MHVFVSPSVELEFRVPYPGQISSQCNSSWLTQSSYLPTRKHVNIPSARPINRRYSESFLNREVEHLWFKMYTEMN